MLEFSTGLSVWRVIGNRFGEVHALAYRYRTTMSAEQGAFPGVEIQQAPHRQGDGFGLVTARETVGGIPRSRRPRPGG
jgi:hypothetical protein